MSTSKPLREEHAEATRKALLGAARRLFARKGFADTSLDEVAEVARVTKGAVYHHFKNKRELFRSVYEELAAEVDTRIRERLAPATEPLARAQLGIEAFLE